jgi:hypothetical protein
MAVKLTTHERACVAAMVVAIALGTMAIVFLLTRAHLWSDPAVTPILAVLLAWLALAPLTLVWYWRWLLSLPVEPSPGDAGGALRGRCRRELYWWVGEAPVIATIVMVIFTTAGLGAAALAGLSGSEPRLMATPFLAWVVAILGACILAPLRMRWLRRHLQDPPIA